MQQHNHNKTQLKRSHFGYKKQKLNYKTFFAQKNCGKQNKLMKQLLY